MADTLFYADAIPVVGQRCVVDGDEGFHAATVRRIRPGEKLVLSDGDGTLARCEVAETSKRGFSALVLERWTLARPALWSSIRLPKNWLWLFMRL